MAKKPPPHDPVKASPFTALKALKDKLDAEAEAKRKAEEARKAAGRERGELEGRAARRPASPAAPARTKPATPEVWRPDLDQRFFEVAMAGVKPLGPAPSRVSSRVPDAEGRSRQQVSVETRLRRAQAEGGPGLVVEWIEGGAVRGVRRGREFALEALDRFAAPQETLDMHGLEVSEVSLRVSEFVRTRRARGLRCVCVVHGRGRNSPDGLAVLLDATVGVLRVAPTANEIDAFATAPDALGGKGALLISLRS